MAGPDVPAVFAGDLGDPWVAAIAAALPSGSVVVSCETELPEVWPFEAAPGRVLVLHRDILTRADAARLARDRHEGRFTRVVLCVGPHARYHALQAWAAGLADAVLPEATAAEVIARYLGNEPTPRPERHRPRITVVGGLHEPRAMLADLCEAAGYPVVSVSNWSQVAPTARLAVWDVPVLEPHWPERLEHYAASRSVVALLGFADRVLVAEARARGASACLDSPCHPADLAFVLDRLAGYWQPIRRDDGHALPPPPYGRASPRAVGSRSPDGFVE